MARSTIDSKYDVDFIIPEEYDRNILWKTKNTRPTN